MDLHVILNVDGGGALAGVSGKNIATAIKQIMDQINSSDLPRLKVQPDFNHKEIQKSLSEAIAAVNSEKSPLIVDIKEFNAKGAINKLRTQLSRVIDSLSLEKGVSITLNASELGEIKEELEDVTKQAQAAQKAINDTNSAAHNASKQAGVGSEYSNKDLLKRQREISSAIKLKDQAEKRLGWTAAKESPFTKGDYDVLEYQTKNLKELVEDLDSGKITLEKFKTEVAEARNQIDRATSSIRQAGKDTTTFRSRIAKLTEKFSTWFTMSQIVMGIVRNIRQMITYVGTLDAAMTELRKVTDETSSTYLRFFDEAIGRAKQLGATVTDTINATADFARLGYGIDEAADLADAALVYKNVGDGIEDVAAASESIISTMKAFGYEANQAMQIVDRFNEVANNYAITAAGIGEALKRSASALAAGGNTLEESIALITTANTILQDPEKVGRCLPNGVVTRRKKAAISVKGQRWLRPSKDLYAKLKRPPVSAPDGLFPICFL